MGIPFLAPIISGIAKAAGGGAIWKGIGGVLASVIGGAGAGAAGAAIDRRADALSRRDEYEFYRGHGATLQEILGAGGVSGASGNMSTVLGNQAAQSIQLERQRAQQVMENDKDRMVALAGQETQRDTANTMAGAQIHAADNALQASLNQSQTTFDIALMADDREQQKILNEWANNNPELNLMFKRMTQGVDNTLVSFILDEHDLLRSGVPMTDRERSRRIRQAMEQIAAATGNPMRLAGEGNRQVLDAFGDFDDALGALFGTGSSINRQQMVPSTVGTTPPMPSLGR